METPLVTSKHSRMHLGLNMRAIYPVFRFLKLSACMQNIVMQELRGLLKPPWLHACKHGTAIR